MKKILLVVVFIMVSLTMNAQVDEAFKKDTELLIEIVSKSAFEPVIGQFTGMVAEDKKEEFKKEANKTLPKLYAAMAKIYMDEFTHDEIKQLLAFYDTPVGKKMASKSLVLAQKGMVAGQSWGMELQTLVTEFQ